MKSEKRFYFDFMKCHAVQEAAKTHSANSSSKQNRFPFSKRITMNEFCGKRLCHFRNSVGPNCETFSISRLFSSNNSEIGAELACSQSSVNFVCVKKLRLSLQPTNFMNNGFSIKLKWIKKMMQFQK